MAFSLSSLTTYQMKWNVVNVEPMSDLDPEGFKQIESAEVVQKEQDWGMSTSICMFLKGGGCKYIALSSESTLSVGDEVDVNSLKVIELEREGETCFKGDGNALVAEE